MFSLGSRQTFADRLQVIGIDIFDRQSTGVQQFHKLPCDLNGGFLTDWMDHFDMINSRFLTDGINKNRWPELVAEYKRLLKPGGWLQMVEARWKFFSGVEHDLPKLNAWSDAYKEAMDHMQKDPDITERRLEWFPRQAGFEKVQKETRRVPVGIWGPGSYLAHFCCKHSSAKC
jgi:SAM-dependent methyltransferase